MKDLFCNKIIRKFVAGKTSAHLKKMNNMIIKEIDY